MFGSKVGIYGQSSGVLLLDLYPNLNGESWALHKINSVFTGDVITIKRDDGTSQSFSFSGSELPISSISSFVGAGDGKVTSWKGQANSQNVTQNVDANCPLLFESGVLVEENGEPALKFSGNQWLSNANILSADNREVVSACVVSTDNSTPTDNTVYFKGVLANFNNRYGMLQEYFFARKGVGQTSELTDAGLSFFNNSVIANQVINGIDHKGYIDNVLIESKPFANLVGSNSNVFQIGAAGGGFPLSGKIQEVNIWIDSTTDASLSGINNKINERYNIY